MAEWGNIMNDWNDAPLYIKLLVLPEHIRVKWSEFKIRRIQRRLDKKTAAMDNVMREDINEIVKDLYE